jgi:hypothetical protein
MQENERDLSRVVEQPLADHGDLPRQATSLFGEDVPEQKKKTLIYVGRTKCCQRVVAVCCDYPLVSLREVDRAIANMVRSDLVITKEQGATIGGRCTCREPQ